MKKEGSGQETQIENERTILSINLGEVIHPTGKGNPDLDRAVEQNPLPKGTDRIVFNKSISYEPSGGSGPLATGIPFAHFELLLLGDGNRILGKLTAKTSGPSLEEGSKKVAEAYGFTLENSI